MNQIPKLPAIRLKPLIRGAIQNGHKDLVVDYLAKGGEINARDHRDRTPLMLAALNGHAELCQILLENKADSSLTDVEGRTALEIARYCGEHEIAALIDQHLDGPDTEVRQNADEFFLEEDFESWQPEIDANIPVEISAVRARVGDAQRLLQIGPPPNLDADLGELAIRLPEVADRAIEQNLQQQNVQEMLVALVSEAQVQGAYRPSLVSAISVELDEPLEGDVFRNISQLMGDMGCVPEEDEDTWLYRTLIYEECEWFGHYEDCQRYLLDLQSLINDPLYYLKKDVALSVLLDREGEARLGRLLSFALYDACNAIASDDRVLSALLRLEKQIEEDSFLASRLSRLETDPAEQPENSFDESVDGESDGSAQPRAASLFHERLLEAIHEYRDTKQSERRKRISAAIEGLGLTLLGLRWIQKELAAADLKNRDLEDALDRAGRLESEMFMANIRLAISVAEKYKWSRLAHMDRVQESFLGLLKAIAKFDFERGYKFSTYATWWLKQSVTRAIADTERTIRVPVHMLERMNKLSRAARVAGFESERDMTVPTLSAIADLSVPEVLKALSVVEEPVRLEESPDAFSFVMTLPDDGESPQEYAERIEVEQIIRESLDMLPDREADVIRHRFGLTDTGEKTLEEVGALYNLTRERIRQIEAKALEKLRSPGNRINVLDEAPKNRDEQII